MTDSNSLDKKRAEDGDSGCKKSRKKEKKADTWRPEGPRDPFAVLDALPEKKQQEIQRALHLFSLGPSLPKTMQQAKKRTYRFWDTQPVPRLGERTETHGPILEGEASVRKEPFSLPQGFSWDTLDLSNLTVMRELCNLLNDNYMEEDDNTVRFDFSPEYLQWALQPPNWLSEWHCAVRVDTNNKLVGFIAAVPADVCIYETEKRMVQVKFLCVHKKLRLKRMTPVLIRELTRRVKQQGIYQAFYAAGIVLPTPLSSCRKLVDVGFQGLRQNMNLQTALKFNRLPEVTKTPGLRPMTKADVVGLQSVLQSHLRKFQLSSVLSSEEVEHWLLPRENVIDTYVVESDDGTLTDVVSFHCTSYKVLNHPLHTGLRAAVLLCVASTATDPVILMEDILVLAKSKGYDVFSAFDVMDNQSFLENLKFSVNDSSLHYYLYNWKCPTMSADKMGFLLPN
ncbi:glycylpeptide N-tetradecanoyltransferase 1-like isoform X2 [Cheilinus undulatus]|uniref:glycylpeptide N-tetradecanoyltransferase 1-like isoform X2 n=1 Tax=Cheilinus undulatus TaxID=241271 RepID=UPI001BD49210|nr:glycylpeptide N-tetradecanoyltransferase 1-like isoform X2 [Cheilinus undulatus]